MSDAQGRQHDVDLLNSDVGLPDGNGYDQMKMLLETFAVGPESSRAITG